MDNIPFEFIIYIVFLISGAISLCTHEGGKIKVGKISAGEARIKTLFRRLIRIVFCLCSLYLMIRTFYALITGDKISVTILIIMIAFAVLLFKILSVIFSKSKERREEAYRQKRLDELDKKLTEKYSSSPIVKAAAERFRSDGSFKELRVYKNYRTSKIPPLEHFKSDKIVYSESESKKIVRSMAKEWEDKVSVIHRNSYNKDDVILYSDFGYEDACEDVRRGLTACLSVILNLPYGFHTGHFEHKYTDITPSSGYIISGNSVTPTGGSSKEYSSSLYLSAYGVVHTPPPEEEIQQPLKLKQW